MLPKRTLSGDRLAKFVWDLVPDAHRGVFLRKVTSDLVVFGHDGCVTDKTEAEIERIIEWLSSWAAVGDYGRTDDIWIWAIVVPIRQPKPPAAWEFHRAMIEEAVWEIWASTRGLPPSASSELRILAREGVARFEEQLDRAARELETALR